MPPSAGEENIDTNTDTNTYTNTNTNTNTGRGEVEPCRVVAPSAGEEKPRPGAAQPALRCESTADSDRKVAKIDNSPI